MSSVALATAALAGLTANAQEKASTQKPEHDHSSSDPGPENKPILDERPNSNMPPPTDHGDVVPLWYSFDLVKKRLEEGGWTHEVTQRVLPSSEAIAGVQMRLTAGSYRELHWHTADEWAYVLYGNCRVTVMNPDGTMFIGDVGEGDLWIFPAGYPHSIQGLGPDGKDFLLVFNQGDFSEDGTVLLSEWVAHLSPEVLSKNTGLDKRVFAQTPGAPLYIFPGNLPNSLEQDKAEIGGERVASKRQYTFHLRSMQPTSTSEAGEVRIVDSRNFPTSKHVVGALLIIKPGHMRELHWHPNASEWQYYISGKGRMTQAAAIGVPYITARACVVNAAQIPAGETILVVGVAGAVGQAATQITNWKKAWVIGADITSDPIPGTGSVINTKSKDLRERVFELMAGKGVNAVFDAVGGPVRAGTAAFTPELLNFLKNTAMMGGLLFIAATESQPTLLPRSARSNVPEWTRNEGPTPSTARAS